MLFWTRDEYLKFADAIGNKPESYFAFEILYWRGPRFGELLALTPSDFDFARSELKVTTSHQRRHGCDVITPPKTPQIDTRHRHAEVAQGRAASVGRIPR